MMRLKAILLGAVLTGVTPLALSNLVQAQVCPRPSGIVSPASETRVIRNERFNYRFQIPTNYKSMAVNNNRILILDPRRFEEAQCLVRNRAGTEFPSSITVYVESVNPGNRSVADFIKQRTPATITGTRTVANQTAVTYNTDAMGYGDANVSFFTSNRRYLITISAPYQSQQNASGERVRGDIFNKSVFDTVVSTFTFGRG